MAVATAVQMFKVHTPHGNLTAAWFIRHRGAVVPDWITAHALPFDGTVPPKSPVFEVDSDAAARELPMDFSTKTRDVFQDEMRRRLGLTDETLTVAIGELNCPAGRVTFATDGLIGQVVSRQRVWRSDEVDRYEALLRRVFPNALPKR